MEEKKSLNRRQVSNQDILGLIIPMEFERGVDPNARKLIRALPILIRRVHGVPAGKGATTVRRLSSAPEDERTGISGRDTVARQRVLIGDSLNDEQWSDDLPSYQTIG